MNKKKLLGFVLTGVLSVGVIGGYGSSAFAATSSKTAKVKHTAESLDVATKEKVQQIKEELKTQLAKLGVTLPERGQKGDRFANLDEATKEKAEAILENQKAGIITKEEAQTQLEALGVTRPEHGQKGNRFANLDDATKVKVESIFEKQKAGTITKEEAQTQLEAIGVTLPERGTKGNKTVLLDNLDDEAQAQAQELIDIAKAELEEIGVTHSKF